MGAFVARAYALTGDLEGARSLVQEAYVRAAVRRSEFGDPDALDAFVWTSIGALHEGGWIAQHPAPLGDLSVPGDGPSQARVALQSELDALPTLVRRSLIDRDLFGWNTRETARDLGTDTAAVRGFWREGQHLLQRHPAAWLEAGHPIPSAPLPYTGLLGEVKRRERRRSGRAALATVVALAVVGAGTALALHRPSPPASPPAGASSGATCPMPDGWRQALRPQGTAWPDATAVIGTEHRAAAVEQSDDGVSVVRWFPHQDRSGAVVLDQESDPSRFLFLVAATDNDVVWVNSGVLKFWDGTATQELSPKTMNGGLAQGGVLWTEPASQENHTAARLRRFDLVTRETTTIREFDNDIPATILDGYYVVHAGSAAWTLYDFSGNVLAHSDTSYFLPLGSYNGAPVWGQGGSLFTLRDGQPTEIWRNKRTDRGGSMTQTVAGSLADGFLLMTNPQTFTVYDLRTGRQAEVPRYVQENAWQSAARLDQNSGMLTYYGTSVNARTLQPPAASGSPSPTMRYPTHALSTPVPDGGPRFTPIGSLPRISCGR